VTTDLPAFDAAIRHRANLRVMFIRLGSTYFPAREIVQDSSLGAQTVIEIQPRYSTLAQVASGTSDRWLRDVFAKKVTALGHAVIVSFAPEMNGQWYNYGSGQAAPSVFVQAWRHVHGVLTSTPAGRLISWIWQPMAIHFGTASPKPWWPGWQYVNEVGIDGYYVSPKDTFTLIFGKTIRVIRSLTRMPILIGEVAVGPSTGRQPGDIKNLFAGIRNYHLRGLVWFDISQHNGHYHQDWRLQDYPPALSSFVIQVAQAARRRR